MFKGPCYEVPLYLHQLDESYQNICTNNNKMSSFLT